MVMKDKKPKGSKKIKRCGEVSTDKEKKSIEKVGDDLKRKKKRQEGRV